MKRDHMIVDFVREYTRDHGYPPTVREIGDAVGLKSSSNVHRYLFKLKKDGIVTYEATKPRTIRVVG